MSGHTPGPWSVGDDDRNEQIGVVSSAGSLLALATHECVRPRPELEANARLIAASPDLLAALKAYVEYHGPTCEHATRDDCPVTGCAGRSIDDAVNAAISKAEGR